MFPIVDGIEAEFAGQVAVIRLNAQGTEITQLMNSYGVRGHPSFVVLDGKDEVAQRFTGPQTEETLREAMAAVAGGR
jgi:protein-disulfide isomerase